MKYNSISIRTGSEGPRHDPYHYEEITINGRNGKTTIHIGLGAWLTSNGVKFRDFSEAQCFAKFEQLTGITPDKATTIYHKLPTMKHSRRCNGRDFECVPGYPGETLEICTKCKEVVDYRFNRSAVE